MIVCPNCNHQNPDGAVQCESCYTPLPATTSCPNCGAMVQVDASFCGQCGFNLRASVGSGEPAQASNMPAASVSSQPNPPDTLVPPDPLVVPDLLVATSPIVSPVLSVGESVPPTSAVHQPTSPAAAMPVPVPTIASTRLQQQTARLLHVQTNTSVELPQNLTVLHIGKPNDRIPPDVDVSGFPDSEIVSRIHADIRVEGDAFYIEDIGSSNGTYINNVPLPIGNRHRLRPGDRIALGKGDKVTFLFQLS